MKKKAACLSLVISSLAMSPVFAIDPIDDFGNKCLDEIATHDFGGYLS